MPGLAHYLTVSALLFFLGLAGFISRKNIFIMFLSLELMLNGINVADSTGIGLYGTTCSAAGWEFVYNGQAQPVYFFAESGNPTTQWGLISEWGDKYYVTADPAVTPFQVVWNGKTYTFHLRQGVRFHDGTPLTPADVVFSVQRAQQPTANISVYANALGTPVAIDPLTVEFRLDKVNPVFQQHLISIAIMNKAWAEKHKVLRPLDFKNKQEGHASLNTNGTGPFPRTWMVKIPSLFKLAESIAAASSSSPSSRATCGG